MSVIDDIIRSVLCLTVIYAPFVPSLTATKMVYVPNVLHGRSKYLYFYFLNIDRHKVENLLKRMSDPYPLIRYIVALYYTISLGILHEMRHFRGT